MELTLKEADRLMNANGGSLNLRDTDITLLPDSLTIRGTLDLRATAIASLPDGLTVGGDLFLDG